eukprot:gb/GFBE01031349.1/.p1 GENE.gb/GFBE01031349.1/~~gb/GFBE01031349.1/.p1  ORF type:complete len:115 (+),score=6.56 gb/GFBE01031349.1/:1-345(+)
MTWLNTPCEKGAREREREKASSLNETTLGGSNTRVAGAVTKIVIVISRLRNSSAHKRSHRAKTCTKQATTLPQGQVWAWVPEKVRCRVKACLAMAKQDQEQHVGILGRSCKSRR